MLPSSGKAQPIDWQRLAETRADTLAQSRHLTAAQADTINVMQWGIEEERADFQRSLRTCSTRADSLRIELGVLIRTQPPEPVAPVWAALGSRTAVALYGFGFGVLASIQIMNAVD